MAFNKINTDPEREAVIIADNTDKPWIDMTAVLWMSDVRVCVCTSVLALSKVLHNYT